jgi:hypothetical protein
MGYEDRERHSFFGFEFEATCAEQRRVVAEVKRSEQYADWHAAGTVAKNTHVGAEKMPALQAQRALLHLAAVALAVAEQKLLLVVAKAIEDLGPPEL